MTFVIILSQFRAFMLKKTIPEITNKQLAFTLNGFLITPKTYNTLELFYHYVPLLSFLLRQKIRYTNFFPSSV